MPHSRIILKGAVDLVSSECNDDTGRSIGACPAIRVAGLMCEKGDPPAALLLHSPFTSLKVKIPKDQQKPFFTPCNDPFLLCLSTCGTKSAFRMRQCLCLVE